MKLRENFDKEDFPKLKCTTATFNSVKSNQCVFFN